MTTVWPQAKQGTVRAARRLDAGAQSPRRPTCRRSARRSRAYEATAWQGLFAPAGTPKPIVEKIAAEAKRIWNLPEVKEQLGRRRRRFRAVRKPRCLHGLHPRRTREMGRGGEGRRREDRVAVTAHATSNRPIGSPVERLEDLRFLRGRGEFVDDVPSADALHAVILRSSVAHGRIRSVDVSAALKRPGVRAVITAERHRRGHPGHHHAAGAAAGVQAVPAAGHRQGQGALRRRADRRGGRRQRRRSPRTRWSRSRSTSRRCRRSPDRSRVAQERKPAVRRRPAAITSSHCRR